MKGIFITGTDTNVGKTYLACKIAEALTAQSINVTPRKPIESGCQLVNGQLIADDALKLQQASQSNESINSICAFKFPEAISPARAAKLNQQSISISQLKEACLNNLADDAFLLVEGAGGFYSPLCEDGLNADLAKALKLPVLLIAENKLGCINHILLSIQAIEKAGLNLNAIILNTPTKNNSDNLFNDEELKNLTHIPILNFNHDDCLSSVLKIIA